MTSQHVADMETNAVAWFEIYVDDLARATAFYETVFETTLETLDAPDGSVEMKSFPMSMERTGASGALCKMDGVAPGPGGTMVYFSCADCGVEGSRVAAAGGTVVRDKTSLGEFGFMVLAMDTEGNMIGLHSMA